MKQQQDRENITFVTADNMQFEVQQQESHVSFGIVHLFRTLEDATSFQLHSKHEPEVNEEGALGDEAVDEALGTVLAMLNVPTSVTVASLLTFCGAALGALQYVRLVHQVDIDQMLVLLKFHDTLDAEEFFKMFQGQPYDALEPTDRCKLVYVTGVTVNTTTSLPHVLPLVSGTEPWPIIRDSDVAKDASMQALRPYRPGSALRENVYELPTCPVCLDRLDSQISVDTQRVWDYAGDGYVHRIIQASSGGKLVELPSASNMAATTPEHLWNARYPGGVHVSNGGRIGTNGSTPAAMDESLSRSSNELHQQYLQSKLEALSTEYSNMIVSQLDSQRAYYEQKLAQQKRNQVDKAIYTEVCEERDKYQQQCTDTQDQLSNITEELKKSEAFSSKQGLQLRRALDAAREARKALEEEKSVSDGLCKHVKELQDVRDQLQKQMAELQEELRDIMFFVSARDKIEQGSDALGIAGGDISVPEPPPERKSKGKKHRK
ncbi:hypothetical protein Malapachy_0943 [Malassezia pachydermatis]|uniref:BRCA1-associated 2/ETP1 RRM domain-containing protein n=1 Tax=Malassezia pachydermatis TaxID=77020 RepID=A0A0M8MQN5_9BASI|nr:hypothetical protein Malapachy_0943 [Malassezia pachydermatis]KOS14897.1 hypothetical protein Malapachy_0943 [Malassezia pachydermatis]